MPYTNPEAGVYDFSGLSQWLVCQRKWWWYGVQSLVVDRPAAALVFGLAIHKGLETWFKGGDVTQMVESFRQSVIDEGGLPADQLRTLAKGELVLKAYAKTYPRPESFKVLATEQSFSLTMPDGSVLAGRMDGVVEWEDGRILVLEHKTTSGGVGSYYFKQFSPNLQVDVYAYACRKIYGRCDGVLVDALQVCKTKEGFARDIQDRSAEDLDRFEKRYCQIVREIETRGLKSYDREEYIQNQMGCTYYGECPYRTLCLYNNDDLIEGTYVARKVLSLDGLTEGG